MIEPPCEVTLTRGFWLGETEVTQRQWIQIMGTEPWIEYMSGGKEDFQEGDDFPAVYICHGDTGEGNLLADSASLFCQKLTEQERKGRRLPPGWKYALPTEAQWEYACRAGKPTTYCFGDNPTKLSDYAWWGGLEKGNAATVQHAHAVGLKLPNAWGLKDMHGNVFEFCSDWAMTAESYRGDLKTSATNPQGPSSGELRICRGGAWLSGAEACRSNSRGGNLPNYRSGSVGFRIVLESARADRSIESTDSSDPSIHSVEKKSRGDKSTDRKSDEENRKKP